MPLTRAQTSIALAAVCLVTACGADPALVSIRATPPAGALDVGAVVAIEVIAKDAAGEGAILETEVLPQLIGRPRIVSRSEIVLENAGDVDRAELSLPLGPQVFAFEGRSELRFAAIMDGQRVVSSPLPIAVTPSIEAIAIRHGSPFGDRVVDDRGSFPYGAELRVEVVTKGMVGRRTLSLDVRDDATDAPIARVDREVEADRIEIALTLPPAGAAAGPRMLRFDVGAPGVGVKSLRATAVQRGLYQCGWVRPDGSPVAASEELGPGVPLRMRAYVFGYEGSPAVIELWEQDTGDNDFVARFNRTVSAGVVEVEWTTEFIDDGFLDGQDEYFFTFDLDREQCRSTILLVES